jgi:hypothetical protein
VPLVFFVGGFVGFYRRRAVMQLQRSRVSLPVWRPNRRMTTAELLATYERLLAQGYEGARQRVAMLREQLAQEERDETPAA